MHAVDKSTRLAAKSDPGVAQQHSHEAADSKPKHAKTSLLWTHNQADVRGSTNILETKGALPTTYWARELEVEREDWNTYLRGNLAVHGQFMGVSCLWWTTFCCLKNKLGGTEEVDVERGGEQKSEHVRKAIFHMRTLSPADRICVAWIFLMGFVDLLYTAFLMPVLIVFPTNNTMYNWGSAVNLVLGGLFYWIDIFMRFRMGFCVVYNLKRELIMDGGLIAHFYIRHNTFTGDFLAAIPAIAELVWVCLPGDHYGLALHIILLLRLFRMKRVFLLIKSMLTMVLTGQYSRKIFRGLSVGHIFMLMLMYITMWLLNLMGCSWIWLAGIEGKENSWMQSIGNELDIAEKTPARQWVAGVYFAVMLITTTGLGDIKPCTPAEEILGSAQMLLGVFLFGLIISTSQEILSMLSDNARRMGPLRDKLQWVELWLKRRHLSSKLSRRVRAYYTEIWANHKDLHHDSFYDELPASVRTEVALEITDQVFEESSLLSVLHDRARRSLCERLKPYSLPAGHDACQEGDDCDTLWMLTEGEMVAIRREKKEEYLVAPDLVGEIAVLTDCLPELKTRPATWQAVAPCTLWTMQVKDLDTVVDLYPDLAPVLQEAFHQHLKNQAKRTPGKAWDHVLKRYEELPERERPFAGPEHKPHLSDDEDGRSDTQPAARMGSSNRDSHTYRHKDAHLDHGYQLSESSQDSPRAEKNKTKANSKFAKQGKKTKYMSAEQRDAGAHSAPSAAQEMQHDHPQYDDTCMKDSNNKHAFVKQ